MNPRQPTMQEFEELAAFLPRLYAEGFSPIIRWGGGKKGKNGVFTMPWPEYNQVVVDFFRIAANVCWNDCDYRPEDAGQMLENLDFVKTASFDQVKTMLTFCVRGERFCDGHWAAIIENGYIRRLLERIIELRPADAKYTD